MVAFCSAVQRLLLIDLCYKFRLWVDFKVESVSIISFIASAAGQEKNKTLYKNEKK